MSTAAEPLVTTIGKAEHDRVILRGYDLCRELVGHVSFGQMTYLMLMGRMPTPGQARMVEALLTVLVEHGMTSSAIAARLTYYCAPEALQGAVAAAILGAGSVHLGSATDCARMLQEALAGQPPDADLDQLAAQIADRYLAERRIIPGLGHRTHSGGDPRADRLFEVAAETGVAGQHCDLLQRIARHASARRGRLLPINVTGAMGAIAADLGLPWQLAKGFAIIGRSLGALAHLADEVREPMGARLAELVNAHVVYQDPPSR
ncbi:MAG TPA: citryl-CoA lyase [Chloroflexota bacterium]|nr:citryl-CoA lyase [Chloroflexota bacterium]